MKRFWLISFLISILFVYGCNDQVYLFTSFHEPANEGLRLLYSKDGYRWDSVPGIFLKPEIGLQKVMRDPSMVQGPDGTFHLVWTSSWRGDLGFGYASSKDLVHWSDQQFIGVMKYDTSTVNVWAPELFYDDTKDRFLIVWSSTIPFKFEKGLEEEKNNHRLYCTTTKDFKSFEPAQLFFDPGFSCIDATIVKRKDRDYVLVFKDNTRPNRNLKVAFAAEPTGPWKDISDPFTPVEWGFCEGPSVAKVSDGYLIYFDAYREKFYGAVKTSDFKSFKSVNSDVSIPKGHKHGTVLKVDRRLVKELMD